MLFKHKNCSKCGSSYDIVEDTCPVCHAHNEDFEALKIPETHLWLPVYKQVMLFLFGFVLLNIISSLMSLILSRYFVEKSVNLSMIINSVRYSCVAGAMAIVLIHSYPKFKKPFLKILPYVVGFASGFLLIGINLAYNTIVSLFYTTATNENQSLANSLVNAFPVASFFLLCFVGPVVEEFTYRVGLFSFLTRIHRAVAYVVTILLFAFIHFDFGATGDALITEFINLPLYMFSGAALCLLYDFMGLSASVTGHIVNNFISILPLLFAKLLS